MQLDVNTLLNKNEDECLEYKEGFNDDDVASTIASFSTNNGGYILLGVKDDGTPKGYRCNPKELDSKLYNLAKNMNGGRAIIEIGYENYNTDSFIVVIRVLEGEKKPYGWKGIYYNRIGSSDEKLSPEQITEILLKSKNLHYDCLTSELFHRKGCINDIDENKVMNYIQKAKTSIRNKNIDFKEITPFLKNFSLIDKNNYVNNASILIFGRNPQSFFKSSIIQLLIYSGDEITELNLKKRNTFDGDLIKQVNEVFKLIKLNTENKIIMEGLKRIEISQYPSPAIREALINALVHRDYSISDSNITIRLFDNRLEIINPGGLMKGVNLEELKKGGHHSVRRNPTICSLFDNLGYMEQCGNGIKSMISAMKNSGLQEPKIEANNDFFKIEFFGQNLNLTENKNLIGVFTDYTKLLTEIEKNGFLKIKENINDSFTINDYMQQTGIKSRITAKKHLTKFVDMEILKCNKVGKLLLYSKSAIIK